MMKQLLLILTGVALTLALIGCNKAPTEAVATGVFDATEQAGDLAVNLRIDPLHIGDAVLVVTVDDPNITAVQIQVIMASVAHGVFVDLDQIAPGRFVVHTNTLDMPGKWLLRTKLTNSSGQSKAVTFNVEVGALCLPPTELSGR